MDSVFRSGATLPWSEDWVWMTPVVHTDGGSHDRHDALGMTTFLREASRQAQKCCKVQENIRLRIRTAGRSSTADVRYLLSCHATCVYVFADRKFSRM